MEILPFSGSCHFFSCWLKRRMVFGSSASIRVNLRNPSSRKQTCKSCAYRRSHSERMRKQCRFRGSQLRLSYWSGIQNGEWICLYVVVATLLAPFFFDWLYINKLVLDTVGKLGKILIGMNKALGEIPMTVKLRTGVKDGKNTAHKLMPRLAPEFGAAAITVCHFVYSVNCFLTGCAI